MGKYKVVLAKVTDVHAREVREIKCQTDEEAIEKGKEILFSIEPPAPQFYPAQGYYLKIQRVKMYAGVKILTEIFYATYSKLLEESLNNG